MIRKIAILIIIFFIFCVFLELGIRFYIFGFRGLNPVLVSSVDNIALFNWSHKSSCPDLPRELKPNLDTFFRLVRFCTNSDGLRDKEYQVKKPANTFRVVVLGSSITMGSGVDIDETFHSLVENRLNSESSNISYEFINFGMVAYTLSDCLTMLKCKALKYEPDLILFCTDGREVPLVIKKNDSAMRADNKMRRQVFFRSYVLELAIGNKALFSLDRTKKLNSGIARNYDDNDKIRYLETLKNILLELSAISKQHNVPICLVRDNFYFNSGLEETKELALKYGLYCIDTSYAFKKGKAMDYCSNKIDPHPNVAAHKIIASILYDYLKKERLLERNNLLW